MSKIFKIMLLAFLVLFLSVNAGYSKTLGGDALRILAIGNSFSEDAIENNLYELARAAGKKIIIGNLYIGGAPLELHVTNAQNDKPAYSYRKIMEDGQKLTKENVRLSIALSDEDWDYISFQQASPLSGMYDTYQKNLPTLISYVSSHVRNPKIKYILHQTWAYQQDSNHAGFANYNRNQEVMYNAIISTSRQVFNWGDFALLVPVGTAIQNMRTTYIGDHLTRDGYHLNLNYGRFVAACTWFEALYHQDVRKNPFIPLHVSHIEAAMAKEAAHNAVRDPFEVTMLASYQL